ncbi:MULTISPECIES: NINE protein [Campylobacter]|uniref:TM2 domain-containing protein n=1 Tax=Campylobacter porcelli TaxID=1660073 RepID=A0A1X9SYJ8_9BACT|nr:MULTISPECIES: NINE protein [unclassified Campylobacter]ARR01256.1 TM2 domain-containing protein [Campylobacter sp. RM6137]MCR8679096.1 NINE protein [Campylobacter sp. RM19072]
MGRNVYIAYLLWFFLSTFSGHRFYCGRITSGFLQLGLFWFGSATAVFLIGYVFLAIWLVWWLIDLFLIHSWVARINEIISLEHSISDSKKLENIEKLYELYKNGAISYEEYINRKDMILKNI